MPNVFDRYLVIDWSAASTPTVDSNSIWTAELGPGDDEVVRTNPATRHEALALVDAIIERCLDASERLLITVDAGFGYPVGTAAALGVTGWSETWELIADLIRDDDRNRNNRFEVAAELNRRLGSDPGPFWAAPRSATSPDLLATKSPFPHRTATGIDLAEYRRCELLMRSEGLMVQSVWKLFTPGSVGGQTLMAIAHLQRLRERHGGRVRVWPFETDEVVLGDRSSIVLAEMWPHRDDGDEHPIRDARQVATAAHRLRGDDRTEQLRRDLLLRGLADADREVAAEEGWILGAPISR